MMVKMNKFAPRAGIQSAFLAFCASLLISYHLCTLMLTPYPYSAYIVHDPGHSTQ